MAVNSTTMLAGPSLLLTASNPVCPAPTRPPKTGVPSELYAPSTTSPAPSCFMPPCLSGFGLTLWPRQPSCSIGAHVALANSPLPSSFSMACLQTTALSAYSVAYAIPTPLAPHHISSPHVPRPAPSSVTPPITRATLPRQLFPTCHRVPSRFLR